VLTVPEGAIIYEGDSTFVERIVEDVPEGKRRVAVEVGLSDGIRTEVIKGVDEGDQVVMQ
jgi:HlyD family secretion protein